MPYSSWRQTDLPELAVALASRPGHEAVRTQVAEILRHGFGAGYESFSHEVRLPEVRGRADLLFGATVFEFKSDLRKEMRDVQAVSSSQRGQSARHRQFTGRSLYVFVSAKKIT